MSILIETRLNSLKLNESATPRKGCLGRLEGVCADFKNPTRNGRLYPRKLWENVFNDELFKEALKSKTLLGELDHPEDRLEVLAGEACIVMTDYRIDEDEGVIYAGFDILDTPRGKILKSLLDYGCVMGVSSRGQGDITNTSNGEVVDEDTYDFACFDVVTTPAVAKARQNVVESVKKTKTFVESVKTQITEAETVGDLNAIKRVIKTTQMPEMDSLLESIDNKCNLIKEGKTITSEKVNKVDEVTISDDDTTTNKNVSAKTIRESKELYSCLNSLRKQVNAYRFRESELMNVISSQKDELNTLKQSIKESTSNVRSQKYSNRRLMNENKSLVTELAKCKETNQTNQLKVDNRIHKLEKDLKLKESTISKLTKSYNSECKKTEYLKSQLANSSNEVCNLKGTITENTNINNDLQATITDNTSTIDRLEKSLKSSQLKESNYKQTITELQERNNELSKQLEALESDVIRDKRTSTKNINEMESEINSYTEIIDNLQTQLESLRQQKDDSIDANRKLVNKCKQLNERVNEYQKTYVANKSKQLGIDPSLVSQHINSGTTITQINKLIEDVQTTKDRYAKLPISESVPNGVLIDSSKKQAQDDEMARLESFVEQLAGR